MTPRVAGALSIVCAAGAWACGLETNGLLDGPDVGQDGRFVDDGGSIDVQQPTDDAGGQDAQDLDGGADVTVDVLPDALADGSTDSTFDARPDSLVTRPDAAATDAPADATPDVRGDAPPDAGADAGPLPIVWDGGAISDPQFFDADWVFFCFSLVSCGQMPSVSACVSLLKQPSSPDALIPPFYVVNSVNNSSPTCSSIAAALGDGTTCPSPTADTCSGNSLVTCRYGFTMSVDCGRLGMACSNGNGNAGCGFGDCAPSQEGRTYCVGSNYVAKCTSGRYEPLLDCQTFGATCVGSAGLAQCRGTGGPCTGGPACNGTSIDECFDGFRASVDCASLYDPTFTCLVSNAAVPYCAAGTACDPTNYMDSCNATNQVAFCNAGVVATYNCRSHGWTRCVAGYCAP